MNPPEKSENPRRNSRLDVERYDLEILLRRPSLRVSIPRRVSQIHNRETVQSVETTCGLGCIRGKWLQSFANRKTYVFVYGVLGSFYGAYYAYFYGSITTLEKRFRLSSQSLGAIASIGEITQIFGCFVLSFLTPKLNPARWIGFGVYAIVISTIISTLPHFIYGRGDFLHGEQYKNSTMPNETYRRSICSESTQPTIQINEEHVPVILLITAQILHGMGGSLYHSLGSTYKWDNVGKYHAPVLLTLLSILKTLGPAFGYWLSSICLKIFVAPSEMPYIHDSDTHWIGAWWLGNLVIGFMLLIPASFIVLFPSTLPKMAVRKIFGKEKSAQIDTANKHSTVKSFFLKPTFNSNNLTGMFNTLGFTTYFLFLPKYVEIQYGLTASDANFIAGSVTVLFSAIGIIIGSSVITRYRPTARNVAGWKIFVGLLSVCGLVSYIFLGCSSHDEEIRMLSTRWIQDRQNNRFSPVCDEHVTLPTPCHAGCQEVLYGNHTKVYIGCNYTSAAKEQYAVPGMCPVDCDFKFVMFLIITCGITFAYATGKASDFWFEMKHMEGSKRSRELTFGMTLSSFLAFVPPPILFGFILDKSCLLWDEDTSPGNCWLYNNEKLRYIINLTAIGFVSIGILFDIGVWCFVKNLQLFDDDDEYFDDYE